MAQEGSDMASVSSHGLMVPNTKANGVTIRLMVKVLSGMLMAIVTMVNSRETNPMAMGSTHARMEPSMRVYGLMTSNMGRDRLDGQTGQSIRANTMRDAVTA